MLVLTRHVHQSIVIGHDVVVTVLEVRGDQVRLGITAPKDIQVHREEVFAALTAANRQAASSPSDLELLEGLNVEPHPGSAEVVPDAPGEDPVTAQQLERSLTPHGAGPDRDDRRVPARGPAKPEPGV